MGVLATILVIAKREFRYLYSDSRLRTVVFVAPFIYAALFCVVYIRHTLYDIPIAVVVQDHSQPVRTLVRMLEASPKLKIIARPFSIEEVKDLMLAGKIDAALVIPENFTRRLKRGEDTFVPTYVNAASMVAANMSAKAMNEVVQTFSAGVEIKTLMKKGERLDSAKQKFMPVKLDMRPLFNPSFNYSNFMVPGILIAILQQVILLGIALSWTGEKEAGTLQDLFGISRSPWVLMIGKAIPYVVINFIVAEFYLRVLFPLNDIPMEGAWYVAIPFTILFIFTVVSWGMWVSALCTTRVFATQLLMFVAMPSFVLSGFTWPLQGMPPLAQFISYCLPMTYYATSFRTIYLAAAPLKYILNNFAVLGAFSLFNVLAAYFVIRRLTKKTPLVPKVTPSLM